jgi:hypothetical protein
MNWRVIALLAFAVIYFIVPDPFPGPVDDLFVALLSSVGAATVSNKKGV